MGASGSKRETIDQRYTVPPPSCKWDARIVRRLILTKKLAPLFPGEEEPGDGEDMEECPICFLFYPGGLNRSSCCKKGVCTECLLQVKVPTSPSSVCPFCNTVGYTTHFTGPMSKLEKEKERREEQKVLEIQLRIRQEEIERDRQRDEERKKRGSTLAESGSQPGSPHQGSEFQPSPIHPLHESYKESEEISRSVPMNAAMKPPQSWTSTSYPPPPAANTKTVSDEYSEFMNTLNVPEEELERLMLMEAIRLSLATEGQRGEKRIPEPIPPNLPISNVHTTTTTRTRTLLDDDDDEEEDSSSSVISSSPPEERRDSEPVESEALDYELALALSISHRDE